MGPKVSNTHARARTHTRHFTNQPVACDDSGSVDGIAVAFGPIVVSMRSQCNGNFEQMAVRKHLHALGMVAIVAAHQARQQPDDSCTMTECDCRAPMNAANFATTNLICVADRPNRPNRSADHDATVN